MAASPSILFVDAYDSFSHNILALLNQELGAEITLIHIDTEINKQYNSSLEDFVAQFSAIVVGPGPGNPNNLHDVGILYDLFDTAAGLKIPVLGICLGFQVLCVRYGLPIERMREPCHGQSKKIIYFASYQDAYEHKDVFEGIDLDDIWATCYNSLGLLQQNTSGSPSHSRPGSSGTNSSFSSVTSEVTVDANTICRVLAVDSDGDVMAIRHRRLPFWGLQFHPESCKSNHACRQLVKNWWHAVQDSNKLRSLPAFDPISLSGRYAELTRQSHRANYHSQAIGVQSIPSSPTTEAIVTKLMDLSTATSNTVTWTKVDTSCSRSQISEFVHNLSSNGSIAMLESTRKGRFSIYSMLSDLLTQNQHSSTSSPYTSWFAQHEQSRFSVVSTDKKKLFTLTAQRKEVWDSLENLLNQRRARGGPSNVPFWGGFIGYLSYESGLDALGVDSQGSKSRQVPEISLLWVERSIVYDNSTGTVYIQSIRKDDRPFVDNMEALFSASNQILESLHLNSNQDTLDLQTILNTTQLRLPDRNAYYSQFDKCQSELHKGNSYELCLTTEATITIPNTPKITPYEFKLYKNLHAHNPVPFGAFLRFPTTTVLSTSPEQYLSWSREGIIDMIPMKGTVKRSPHMTFSKACSILSSAKESAENLMIADLIRHDLYNTVGYESKVEVVKLCEVVEHETVYQLVSHIRAHSPASSIADEHNSYESEKQRLAIHYGLKTLSQNLPPGSMTGAPKKRSCKILAGLERRNRGIYSGVLGYMDVGGGGNWSVCIRTAYRYRRTSTGTDEDDRNDDVWHLGAGGAVTVLSDAEGEWQEMIVKLNSVLQGFVTVKESL